MGSENHQPRVLCVNHAPEILELLRMLPEAGYRISTQPTPERDLDALGELAPDLITIDYMWTTSDSEWAYLTMLRMDPRTRDIQILLCYRTGPGDGATPRLDRRARGVQVGRHRHFAGGRASWC